MDDRLLLKILIILLRGVSCTAGCNDRMSNPEKCSGHAQSSSPFCVHQPTKRSTRAGDISSLIDDALSYCHSFFSGDDIISVSLRDKMVHTSSSSCIITPRGCYLTSAYYWSSRGLPTQVVVSLSLTKQGAIYYCDVPQVGTK